MPTIDYGTVFTGKQKIGALAAAVTLDDLKAATEETIDELVGLIRDLSDAQIVAIATDPAAEGGVGWNVGLSWPKS